MRTLKTSVRQGFQCIEEYKGGGHVDYDNGIIRNVKILGKSSRNNREYTPEALRSAAALYRGARVNLDHPEKSQIKSARSIRDWIGQLENIAIRGDAVYGDLHLIKSHPHSPAILEAADKHPGRFGLSHNADCSGFHNGQKQVIESVDNVRSVDLVINPATNSSLFESTGNTMRRLLEMDGMADMGSAPGNGGATTFKDQVKTILSDTTMGCNQQIEAIRELLGPDNVANSSDPIAATEGYNGQRSALSFRNSKELSRLIDGKTPRGPQHSSARSQSVVESSSGQQSALSFRNSKELSKLIGGKRR